jgi:hypothetical protein
MPGSLSAALAGMIVGQLYHTDQFGLKSYRLPLNILRLSKTYLRPIIGATPPLRGSSRAVPQNFESFDDVASPPNEAVEDNERGSIVQDLVTQFRGREASLRNPTQEETDEVSRMFPNVPRQTVTVTLQRRCVE